MSASSAVRSTPSTKYKSSDKGSARFQVLLGTAPPLCPPPPRPAAALSSALSSSSSDPL